jgi:hypothetical protein
VGHTFLLFNLTEVKIRLKVLGWVIAPSFHGTKGTMRQRIGTMSLTVAAIRQPFQQTSCDQSGVDLCAPTDMLTVSSPTTASKCCSPCASQLVLTTVDRQKNLGKRHAPSLVTDMGASKAAPPTEDLCRQDVLTFLC